MPDSIAIYAPIWLDTVLSEKGNPCGNCGAWRGLEGREIVRCICGDDAYDVYEAMERALEIVK